MPRIYISYRPVDSSRNEVRHIKARLIDIFGAENIMDTAGDHMETTLERQAMVESCDILLVVIGQYWLDMVDEQGNLLLEDPYDPVHVELSAGQKSARVIRILLVDNTENPTSDDLPEVLRWIAHRDKVRISDVEQLDLFIDEFIEYVTALPDRTSPKKAESLAKTIVTEPAPEPVSPQQAQRVLHSNPPYVPPAQRNASRRTPSQASRTTDNRSENNQWKTVIGIVVAIFSCLLSALGNNSVSNTRNSSQYAVETLLESSRKTIIPRPTVLFWEPTHTSARDGLSNNQSLTLTPILIATEQPPERNATQSALDLRATERKVTVEAFNANATVASNPQLAEATKQANLTLTAEADSLITRRMFLTEMATTLEAYHAEVTATTMSSINATGTADPQSAEATQQANLTLTVESEDSWEKREIFLTEMATTLEAFHANMTATAEAQLNATESAQSGISYRLLQDYDYPVADIAFYGARSVLYTYEPRDEETSVWYADVSKTTTFEGYYANDTIRANRATFDRLAENPNFKKLGSDDIRTLQSLLEQPIVFNAVDSGDGFAIALTADHNLYLLDEDTLEILQVYQLFDSISRPYEADKTIVYIDRRNWLMVLTDDRTLVTFKVDDTLELLKTANLIGSRKIHQMAVDVSGTYLAVRSTDVTHIFEIVQSRN